MYIFIIRDINEFPQFPKVTNPQVTSEEFLKFIGTQISPTLAISKTDGLEDRLSPTLAISIRNDESIK